MSNVKRYYEALDDFKPIGRMLGLLTNSPCYLDPVGINSERYLDLAPLPNEEFRPIPGFEGYEVSNFGRVKSVEREAHVNNGVRKVRERIICPFTTARGNTHVTLYQNLHKTSRSIRALIREVFPDAK